MSHFWYKHWELDSLHLQSSEYWPLPDCRECSQGQGIPAMYLYVSAWLVTLLWPVHTSWATETHPECQPSPGEARGAAIWGHPQGARHRGYLDTIITTSWMFECFEVTLESPEGMIIVWYEDSSPDVSATHSNNLLTLTFAYEQKRKTIFLQHICCLKITATCYKESTRIHQ